MKNYFITWLKLGSLLFKKYNTEKLLKKHPDLRHYRGHKEVKEIINGWRSDLKQIEHELQKLLK